MVFVSWPHFITVYFGKIQCALYASIVVLVCDVLHMLLTAFAFVITTTFILQEWWFYLWRRIAEKCLEDFESYCSTAVGVFSGSFCSVVMDL